MRLTLAVSSARRKKKMFLKYLCPLFCIFKYELNDLRKIICLRKSEVYVKTKTQFLLSLKNGWSMAYTDCHAPIQMTPQIYHHSNYDVTLMSKCRCGDDILPMGLSKTFDNSVVPMVTDL